MESALIAAEYVIRELRSRHPKGWLGAPRSGMKWDPSFSLLQTVENFSLRSVREDSRQGLLGWLRGEYPLTLVNHQPTPREMLEIQCKGGRYVSILQGESKQIGRHKGYLEFMLHDLEHAHKFYGDPVSFRGQVRFFNSLKGSIDQGFFDHLMDDPEFNTALDYLKADMNTHPIHSLKYLKAIVLLANLRKSSTNQIDLSDFWRNVFSKWLMPENCIRAGLLINSPDQENHESRQIVYDFFTGNNLGQ